MLRGTDDQSARDERLFATHYLPVMRVCLRRLGDVDDAEDAVQEVFRRAVQQGADLRGDPLPWLITVAKHVCLDELRRRRSGRAALERRAALAAGDDAATADPAGNPERVVVGHMFVRELLGRLTPAERRVMATRVYGAASSTDTAELLGVSSSTTRVLLARARQKLRAYLEDGQATLAGVPLLVTRSLHGMRRRLLERPWDCGGNVAFALPAALVFAIATAPATAAPPAARHAPLAAAGQPGAPGAAIEANTWRAAAFRQAGGAVIGQHGAARSSSTTTAPLPPEPSLVLFSPGDAHRVYPTDVQPSPNYSQDHTILLLGTAFNCEPPPCTNLFKSTDNGATWSGLPGIGLKATTLALPATSFAQGRFYASGGLGGLQMTSDGGIHFITIMPAGGYVTAAPATSNLNVVLTNQALWRLQGVTPIPFSTFDNPYAEAGGQPVFVHAPGGDEMLQPVVLNPPVGNPPDQVLRCSPVCGSPVDLPFSTGQVEIVPSPNQAADHTIFASSMGSALGVSHDDGRSFTFVGPVAMQRMIVIPGPRGLRLVAIMGRVYPFTLQVSDDGGHTWQMAGIDPSLDPGNVLTLTSIQGTRLMATVQRRHAADYYYFACSPDGLVWSSCASGTER